MQKSKRLYFLYKYFRVCTKRNHGSFVLFKLHVVKKMLSWLKLIWKFWFVHDKIFFFMSVCCRDVILSDLSSSCLCELWKQLFNFLLWVLLIFSSQWKLIFALKPFYNSHGSLGLHVSLCAMSMIMIIHFLLSWICLHVHAMKS